MAAFGSPCRPRSPPPDSSFHVDLSIGDPVVPAPTDIEVPRLLGGTINVRGYPLALVHAEKIVTAIARGTVNTRWRDFMDVVALAQRHPINGDELIRAIAAVANHRQIDLLPLAQVLDGYGDIGQDKWAGWRRRQQVEDRTPNQFSELLEAYVAFADPAITGAATGRAWDPRSQNWR